MTQQRFFRSISPAGSAREQEFLRRFIAMIELKYHDAEYRLPAAASDLAVSKRLLQKRLRELMDNSFTEYLRSYRLRKAAQLLTQGKKAMDVADETGFSSQAYFGRCFKAQFGVTAIEYQLCPH